MADTSRRPAVRAVVFDLDGVLTDTAEFHYLGWQRLADEEDLPFDRAANEALRGVSRRDSLLRILDGREVDEDALTEMMERKNRYYVAFLGDMTPDDLLPGAVELVVEAKRRGFQVAIGSSSRNARRVLDGLQVTALFDTVADGHTVERAKPEPDLFLAAADALEVPPAACVVVEDAASGVDAALAAGMVAVGIGPEERVGHAHHRFDTVADVDLALVAPPDTHRVPDGPLVADGWVVVEDRHGAARAAAATRHLAADGELACTATPPESPGEAAAACTLAGAWEGASGATAGRWPVPSGLYAAWAHDGAPVIDGDAADHTRRFDVRLGRQWRRLVPVEGPVAALVDERFVAMDRHGVAVQRQRLTARAGSRLTLTTGIVAAASAPGGAAGQVHEDALTVRLGPSGSSPALSTAHAVALAGARVHHERAEQHERHLLRVLDVEVDHDGEVVLTQVMAARVDDDGAPGAGPALAAVRAAVADGHDVLLARHAEAWDGVWSRYDITLDGDPVVQAAVRFALYHQVTGTAQDPHRAGWPATTSVHGTDERIAAALTAAQEERPDEARDLVAAATTDLLRGTDPGDGNGPVDGVWQAVVLGIGGVRVHDGRVELAPRLPTGWTRLAFHVDAGGGRVAVTATPGGAEVRAADDNPGPVALAVHGHEVVLAPGDLAGVAVDGGTPTGTPA